MTKKQFLKYRLGLDLGVSSIGSAVVEIDKNGDPIRIVDAGVRIFPISDGAKDRREKRSARKNTIRTQRRLQKLGLALAELALWEYSDNNISAGTKKIRATNVYKYRNLAVTEKIENPHYIGRIFMHLAKHRGAGYISAQQETEAKETESDTTKNIKKSKQKKIDPYEVLPNKLAIKEFQTIGQYFYSRLETPHITGKRIRQKKDFIGDNKKDNNNNEMDVNYAIPRYLVKDEFHIIWDKQAQYYPQMQDEKVKQKIYDILFYERPPMPYAIGKCIFINDEYCLSKAHPLAEQKRIYSAVHNIRLGTAKIKLAQEQIQTVVNKIMTGEKGNITNIKKWLGLEKNDKVVLSDEKNGIAPYVYATDTLQKINFFKNLSESDLIDIIEFISNPVNTTDAENRLYTEDQVIQWLQDNTGETDEHQLGKILTALPTGRTNLGETATMEILNTFKNADTATSERYITDTLAQSDKRFLSVDDKSQRIGAIDKLPYYGEILTTDTQPIADWMYDNTDKNTETKNALDSMGHPITPENILKYKLAEQQKWQDAYNPENNIKSTFINCEVEHLIPKSKGGSYTPANLVLINRGDNSAKGNQYPYEYLQRTKSPEQIREIYKLVDKLPDNKKWRFASDAQEIFESDGDADATNRYMTDTRYFVKLASRYVRPIMVNPDTPIVAIKGQHTANLRKIWNVLGIEYELRGNWATAYPRYVPCPPYWRDKITGEEKFDTPPNEKNWQQYDKKRNPAWLPKPRFDHRHHALDAIVVALTSHSIQQKMAKHDKKHKYYWSHNQTGEVFYSDPKDTDNYTLHKRPSFPVPLPDFGENKADFRKMIIQTLQKIKVSHKPDHRIQGQLHKDTGKRVIKDLSNDKNENVLLTVYERPAKDVFKDITSLNKPFVADKNGFMGKSTYDLMQTDADLKEHIETAEQGYNQIQQAIKNKWDLAKNELNAEDLKNQQKGNKAKSISDKMILNRAIDLAYTTDKNNNAPRSPSKIRNYAINKTAVFIPTHGGTGIAYTAGNNHRIDIYHDTNGKIQGEVIRMFDASNPNFTPKWQRQQGTLLYKLHIDDILEMNTPEKFKKLELTHEPKCFVKITGLRADDNRIICCLISDAGNGELAKIQTTVGDKKQKLHTYMNRHQWGKSVSTFAKQKARKVELTPFGKIRRKHKMMADKKTNAPKLQKISVTSNIMPTKQRDLF